MSILNQKTLKKHFEVSGIGLHTGKKVKVKVFPSKPNTGIIFKRTDIKNDDNIITPTYYNVSDTTLCTTISNNSGVKVSTIEHFMGAMYGVGIDNLIVELDSQEMPILDGSAKDWINLISNAGIDVSSSPIKVIKINKKVLVKKGEKLMNISPSKVSLDINFEIKYSNCSIGNQKNKINMFNDDLTDIYNSRTFCKYEDIDKLKSLGLAQGGSLDNAIVVKDYKILNDEGLRNDKEFVNHKILDCMGDLHLSGYRIVGSIICSQGGHTLTNELLKKIFNEKSNYSIFELKGKNLPHSLVDKIQLKSIA